MAFIFFINILISFPFSILMIWRNRGQLLDRPEWRVIPELTICFVLFTFSLLGSWIFPFFSQDTKKIELIDVVVLVFVILLVFLCKSGLLNALNEIANRKLLLSNNGDGNSDSPNYNLEEKREYHKELFSYISYTVIYFSLFFLFLVLLEFVVLEIFLSDHSTRTYKFFGLQEKKDILKWGLQEIRIFSIVGIGFTLSQMLENFKFSKAKIQKNQIANLKEYLAETSVKN
ncbi:hypothetical protein D7V82_21980 [bacterium 1xD8-6]|nr:hypothetical protein D7V72_21875 [bacterium D16-36]RKI62017.1 hypothetical protein D7V82_21980 [bacterium 1xD8-6]